MKETAHKKGHRWTGDEIKMMMKMWGQGSSAQEIADFLGVTVFAVQKHVVRLRQAGVPLECRNKGHRIGRHDKLWSQGEIEFLTRRRSELASTEEIAHSLGRTINAVNAMIGVLRASGVPIAMRGAGRQRLYDVEALKAVALVNIPDADLIAMPDQSSKVG